MSKHWDPASEIARVRPVSYAPAKRRAWPAGATAGVVLVAACCAGVAVLLYQVATPRDIFAP